MALLEKLSPAQRTHSERDLLYSILLGTGGTLEKLPLSRQTYSERDLLYSILLNGISGGGGGGDVASVFGRTGAVTAQNGDYAIGDITGAGTMASQNANGVAITGGTIDGTVIGGGTPAAGTFTQAVLTGSDVLALTIANASRVGVDGGAQLRFVNGVIAFGGPIGWPMSGTDLYLDRDAANTLAQRNGANAQVFNLYNTYTDGSNYERAQLEWSGDTFNITTSNAGSGTLRSMSFQASSFNFQAPGSIRWQINSSGHLLAGTDNTYDIGASGATRPRNVFIGNTLSASAISLSSDANFRPLTGGTWRVFQDFHNLNGAILNFELETTGGQTLFATGRNGTGVSACLGISAQDDAYSPDVLFFRRSAAVCHVRNAADSAFAELTFLLPTANPGPGTLWNNGGVLTLGT